MIVKFIPKRRPDQEYMDAPDDDWISLIDFCGRVVYLRPDEVEELIAQINAAISKNRGGLE